MFCNVFTFSKLNRTGESLAGNYLVALAGSRCSYLTVPYSRYGTVKPFDLRCEKALSVFSLSNNVVMMRKSILNLTRGFVILTM